MENITPNIHLMFDIVTVYKIFPLLKNKHIVGYNILYLSTCFIKSAMIKQS